MQKLGVMMSFV